MVAWCLENNGVSSSQSSIAEEPLAAPSSNACMQEFSLYETRSNFYMIGRDKGRTYWRVLKIDRLDPCELNIHEDSTTYTKKECSDLLRWLREGNKSTGGLKFVTTCYGIVGFIKFLGPYYMLLITKRRKIGAICGHTVYAVSKSEIIPFLNSTDGSRIANSRNENRYKKLLCMVDLTKDFFFSYSYHVMRSLQKNLSNNETGHVLYETMFVWNEFLTREIRNHLQNTVWTVALVYGFFKQETLCVSEREFKVALIARRSRHYAGTRYLKRGVNEKGRVANDVETEQIVFEDVPEGLPMQISSVVQNRGSIPLFWSQETSHLNLKPDIILSKKDQNYEATRLHFENLVKRYENPIIILNLIKTHEKKPRESILRAEFANAIEFINKDLSEENRLRFRHWDLHKHSRSKATNVLLLLGEVAAWALTITGFFYCQVTPALRHEGSLRWHSSENIDNGDLSPQRHYDTDDVDADNFERKLNGGKHGASNVANGNHSVKEPMFQRGVLRTNCIDCLDRTNVAQYAYGLAALGHQLHALGLIDKPKIVLDAPLADNLMGFYERMGDTLAHQYGGSAAHNKIFFERRGQWKVATQSQEFFRTLQRHYSNAFMDAEKQDAIDVFLGHFRLQQGKPALWELGSDQHYDAVRNGQANVDEDGRSIFKRSLSDGNLPRDIISPISATNEKQVKMSHSALPDQSQGASNFLSEPSPEISTRDSDIAFSRFGYITGIVGFLKAIVQTSIGLPSFSFSRSIFKRSLSDGNLPRDIISPISATNEKQVKMSHSALPDQSQGASNFLSEPSPEISTRDSDIAFSRTSVLTNSSLAGLSSENVVNGVMGETTPSTSEYGYSMKDFYKGNENSGTLSKSSNVKGNHQREPDKLEEAVSENGQNNIVTSLAEKAVSVAGPVVPMKERLVALLGGLLKLFGKLASLWRGIHGAMSLTNRLNLFRRLAERPLFQRILGFVGMVFVLWSLVVIPLLPTLMRSWMTNTPSRIAELVCVIGLYTATTILVMLWGRRIRGYEDALQQYGLDLTSSQKIQNFLKGLIGGVVLVLSIHSVNVLIGCVSLSWPPTPSRLDAMTHFKVYGRMLMLAGQGIVTATGVAFVEELVFRSWLPKEIEVDLGYHQGIIISGLAFALFQRSPQVIPGLWLLSLGLAGAYQRSEGSLSIPIGLRAGIMASSFVLQKGAFLTYKSNFPLWVTGAHPFQPFSGVVGLAFALVMATILYPTQPPRNKKLQRTIRE